MHGLNVPISTDKHSIAREYDWFRTKGRHERNIKRTARKGDHGSRLVHPVKKSEQSITWKAPNIEGWI
jgi:hypothetical protein